MPQNLSNFDAILKEFYEEGIRNQLNQEVLFLKELEKGPHSWKGRRVVFPVRIGRSEAVGFRADRGTLPSAQHQRSVESRITAGYLYGRIDVTGPTIVASENSRGAFAEAVAVEVEGMAEEMKEHLNSLFFGAGAGVLALINGAVSASATVVVDTPLNLTLNGTDSTKWIRANMVLDAYTAAGAQEMNSITVSSVDSTTQITMASTQTITDNSLLYLEDERSNVPMGLSGIIDDGTLQATLQNITRTAGNYPDWQANLLTNSGVARALSLRLMQQAVDQCNEQGAVTENDLKIWCYMDVRREYIDLLTPDVRYSALALDAGYKKDLTFNGVIPVMVDRNCPNQRMFFVAKNHIFVYPQKDFHWANEDGSILRAAGVGTSGVDSWEAFMRWVGNIGTDRPNSCALLSDLTIS